MESNNFGSAKQLKPRSASSPAFAKSRAMAVGVLIQALLLGVMVFQPRGSRATECLSCQDAATADTLVPGLPLQRQIKGGENLSFRIFLTPGQYVQLLIQLRGIIVRAEVLDPAGSQLIFTSNPSGGYGTIYLSGIAKASGEHTLAVRSTEDWANPGFLEVRIDEIRPSTPADTDRVEAERLFARALREDEARSFKSAVENYEKALSYWKSVRDPHWEALTLFAIGQTYRRSGNLKKEEEALTESLRVEVGESDWRVRAAALNDLGFNSALGGDNEKAILLLNQSLKMFEAHDDRRGQASSLNNLAITYGRMGELRKSRELIERALPLRQAENFQAGVNNLRNTLGAISDRLGDPFKALEYQILALEGWKQLAQAKQIDGPDRLANAFNSAALASEKVGNWDAARWYYDEALALPAITSPLRAAILNNQGALYTSLSDFDSATRCFDAASKLLDALRKPDPDLRASVMLNTGQISVLMGRLDDALQQFQQARSAKPNNPKLAYVLVALGDTWIRRGNSAEALKAYHDALAIHQKIEDRRGQAISHQKLGEAYTLIGEPDTALKEYGIALSLWRAIIDRRGEAATLNNLALHERDRNRLNQALERSEEAINMLESLRTNISSHQLRTSYFAGHENYYELNIDLTMNLYRINRSTKYLSKALEARERSRARSLIDTLAEARVRTTNGETDPLLKLNTEVERQIRAKLEAQTILLSTKHNQKEADEIAKEVSSLIKQQDGVKGKIRATNPKYSHLTQPQPLTVAEIQQQLDANTLLLEFSLGEKRSYLWAVTPNSLEGFELPARAEIEAVAKLVSKSITERNQQITNESPERYRGRIAKADRDYITASAALSKMVLDPVAPLLGKKNLVIVADGDLQLISFGGLPAPKDASGASVGLPQTKSAGGTTTSNVATLLMEDHSIVYEPSASVLALQRSELRNRKPAPYAVAVLANPVFEKDDPRVAEAIARASGRRPSPAQPRENGQTTQESLPSISRLRSDLTRALDDVGLERLPPLRFSSQEAASIITASRQGRTMAALNFDANRAKAMSEELSKYRIVHFATHGVVDFDHPELSGIVLSLVDEKGQPQDGYLRLHDIYNLNLPADLVVLSACQTGIGKQIRGEGLMALTRGFMYAGAQRVVASLWKVDDAATAELMAEFYKQMFTQQLPPSAALRAAQKTLSRRPARRSPYFWAGFVLQGEWK